MTRPSHFLFRLLASLVALALMFGALLIIAYYYELGTVAPEARPPVLAVTGVTMLNLTDASFVPNTTILTSGRRILAIQPDGPVPDGARIIHAAGRYAMPPLANAAVYFEAPTENERSILAGEWAWEITRSLPEHRLLLVATGVANVQDLGGGLQTILNTRRLLAADKLAGPHLLVAGPILTVPGGCPAEEVFPDRYQEATRQVLSPADAEQAVQSLAGAGVNAISVCFSEFSGLFARMDAATLDIIVSTAHQHGLPVLVTTASIVDVQQAVAASVDALVGGVSIQDESLSADLLAAMQTQGTLYIPTLSAVQARQDNSLESLSTAQANTRLAYQAGVPILAGSGTPVGAPYEANSLNNEIRLLVDSGLTEIDALRAATTRASHFLQRPELGRIQIGGPASLLLLAHNPLDDIGSLDELELFVQDGAILLDHLSTP